MPLEPAFLDFLSRWWLEQEGWTGPGGPGVQAGPCALRLLFHNFRPENPAFPNALEPFSPAHGFPTLTFCGQVRLEQTC